MGASVPAQARALLVKSAVYQRRNTATNICLVAAPIFFCLLLALLQLLANKLILGQRANKCGCQCLDCCIPRRVQRDWTEDEQARIDSGETLRPRFVRIEECRPLQSGYCERVRNATCRSFNDSACSVGFSSPLQAIFCPIPHPSSWPPTMQTPRRFFRAGGATTQWMLYTGSDLAAADAVAARMFTAPELPNLQAVADVLRTSPLALLTLRPAKLLQLILPALAPGGLVAEGGEMVDAAQLSRLGFNWGTSQKALDDYYVENAFINSNSNTSQVQLILPYGRCNASGLQTSIANISSWPLLELMFNYYNATYPLLGSLFKGLNITSQTLLSGLSDTSLSNITGGCVDAWPRQANSTEQLVRRLYCGFGSARCDGTFFIREYGAAWDFRELGPTTLRYDVLYNLSLPASESVRVNYRIPQLLNMATRGWTDTYWGTLPIVARIRNRLLGLMSTPKLPTTLQLDFSVLLGPLFYTWVIQMLLPSLLQQLVYEKEKRLRMMMKMHGLSDLAYWIVTYLWYLMLYCTYMVFFVVFGSAIRLKLFTTSSYSLQAVLYFIFGNNMIASMFLLSSLFTSSRTATVVAFLYVFATGLVGELLLRSLMQQRRGFMLAVELVPGFALYRGLFEFSEYSIRAIFGNTDGLRWSNLSDPGNGMLAAWAVLAAEWPVFMVAAWYLEQTVSSGTGMRRHPLYFIRWMWHKPSDDLAVLRNPSPAATATSAAAGTALGRGGGGRSGDVELTGGKGRAGGHEGGAVAKVAVAEGVEDAGSEAAGVCVVGSGGGAAHGGAGSRTPSGTPGGSRPRSAVSGGGGGGGAHSVGDVLPAPARPGSGGSGGGDRGGGGEGGTASGTASGGVGGGTGGGGEESAASGGRSVGGGSHTVIAVGSSAVAGGGPAGGSLGSRSPGGGSPRPGSARPDSRSSSGATSQGDARIIVQPLPAPTARAIVLAPGAQPPASKALAAASVVPYDLPPRGGGSDSGGGGGGDFWIDASDVAAEADRVAALGEEGLAATPIVVRGLAKVFAGGSHGSGGGGRDDGGGLTGCLAACGGGAARGRAAVRSLTLGIGRGECFGLLGPNGAGKTTTLNMLTGFLEPTAGDAFVEGRSVRTRMQEIYRIMGVCPQDNLVWEQLTGEEHLYFYGRLKGLKGKPLAEAVDAALRSVKLHVNDAGRRRVGAYSGGMKRRLSVAISFIGDPQVVYLDEPSTGLDPASRRALWDVVRRHKEGRAIILTTHSMEEAQVLCDRLGIFVDGQLVCIGNPREITARYADYLVFTLTVGPGHEAAAKAFVSELSPRARLTYSLGGTFKYELPSGEVSLSAVFDAVAAARQRMLVLDWGVANATLEEVFIKFARQIGAETRDQ